MSKLLYYGLAPQLMGYCSKTSHKKKTKQLSNKLKTLACNKRVVSLSSLQIGQTIQHFVMLNKQYIKDNEWKLNYKSKNSHYRDILNAQIIDFSTQRQLSWQQCISYPGIRMLINRNTAIKLQYMDEQFKLFKEQFSGFQALIIQHQIQHYHGLDYLKKSEKIEILDVKLRDKYQEQCNQLLKRYREQRTPVIAQPQQQANNMAYNKLKQFITYSIIDKMKDM